MSDREKSSMCTDHGHETTEMDLNNKKKRGGGGGLVQSIGAQCSVLLFLSPGIEAIRQENLSTAL